MTAPKDKSQDARKVEAPEAAPAVANDWPKWLKSKTLYGYTDPDTKISYRPHIPVRVDAAPKEGSWLDTQMKAGHIGCA